MAPLTLKRKRALNKESDTTTQHTETAAAVAVAEEQVDDYMADFFVEEDEHSNQRRKGKINKAPLNKKVIMQRMEHNRAIGLQTKITSGIGHKLLTQMAQKGTSVVGYNKSTELSNVEVSKTSSAAAGAGYQEPLALMLKTGRGGIGADDMQDASTMQHNDDTSSRHESGDEKSSIMNGQIVEAAFRETTTVRFNRVKLKKQLWAARNSIEDLDSRAGMPRHRLWPPEPKKVDEVTEEEEYSRYIVEADDKPALTEAELEDVRSQLLDDCIHYLRNKHNYCIYCLVPYQDSEDMAKSCPGLYELDHEGLAD